MTVSAQSQFLRIFSGLTTYHRWQSYYANTSVIWDAQQWAYQSFNADGIVASGGESEGSLTIGMPVTSITLPAIRQALQYGHLVEIQQYQFDPQLGNSAPQTTQQLITSYLGEVIGMKGRLTWLKVELGSSLAPIGIQVPPRTMTSQLIGVPAQL